MGHQPQMTASDGDKPSSLQAYVQESARITNPQERSEVNGGARGRADTDDVDLDLGQVASNASSLAGDIGLRECMALRRKSVTIGKSPASRMTRVSTGRTRPSPMMRSPMHRPGRGGAGIALPSPLVPAYISNTIRAGQLQVCDEGFGVGESLSPDDVFQTIVPPVPTRSQVDNETRLIVEGRVVSIMPSALMQIDSNAHASGANWRTKVVRQTSEQSFDIYKIEDEEERNSGSSCSAPKLGKRSLSDLADEPRKAFEKLSAARRASLMAWSPRGKSSLLIVLPAFTLKNAIDRPDSTRNEPTHASKANKANNEADILLETKLSSHKVAEQKRRFL